LIKYLDRLNRPLTADMAKIVDKWTLQDEARLVIVINSLWSVGDKARYKVLIVDEAGLVRRHVVGSTLSGGTKAIETYEMVKRLVGRADNVISLQDGLERGDVGFYTGMQDFDPEDRRYVTGYKFEKPIRIHDIAFSDDLYDILGPMLDRYGEMATKADHDGRIESPFLVLTSSLGFAEMLYELLGGYAATDAQRNRIRLMTNRQRKQPRDDFNKYFEKEPDTWGCLADVIICTPVIGAGVSIEAHFTHFYAYFFNNSILTHMEERQFVQQLRYWSAKVPEDVDKQSYLWVERWHSSGVCCDAEKLRDTYDRSAEFLLAGYSRVHLSGGRWSQPSCGRIARGTRQDCTTRNCGQLGVKRWSRSMRRHRSTIVTRKPR
jgi:hypothetical protein